MTDLAVEPRAYTAPPAGRWWRLYTLVRNPSASRGQYVAEIVNARTRKFHADLYKPNTFDFVVDGRDPAAASIVELQHDLAAFRWDPFNNRYYVMFRGPVGRSVDTVTETGHTVQFSCADYQAVLERTWLYSSPQSTPFVYSTATDQAAIVSDLVTYNAGNNAPLQPPLNQGVYVWAGAYNPDASVLGTNTGITRTRDYSPGGQSYVGPLIEALAACQNGFDWSCEPVDPGSALTPLEAADSYLWYPQRGVTKAFVLEYGGTVQSLTRTVNSADFANAIYMVGNTQNLYASAFGDVYANPQLHPEGWWMWSGSDNSLTSSSGIGQAVNGKLALMNQVVPAWTAVMVPGAWRARSDFWLGDTVELRVNIGRLANVDTFVRVVAMDIAIDDNGVEQVTPTLGRPSPSLAALLQRQQQQLQVLSGSTGRTGGASP